MSAVRLEGLGVVITRPQPAADALAAALAREGARPFVFPALAIEDTGSTPRLEDALARLPECGLGKEIGRASCRERVFRTV